MKKSLQVLGLVLGLTSANLFPSDMVTAAPTTSPAAPVAKVAMFSPLGSTKDVRQVHARFSVPVVAFGDRGLPDPFDVNCSVPGQGSWADSRNWTYDFQHDLPGGLRCRFTLKPGLLALDGSPIGGERAFSFDTGGPSILTSFPRDGWGVVDEEQVFLLRLHAEATAASVRQHAFCVIDGVQERVPVEVLEGEARDKVLAQREALGYGYYELLWKSGDVTQARVRDRSLEIAEQRVVVLQCRRRLPSGTEIRLVWGGGIVTPSGIATRQNQTLAFRVRSAFTVRVVCTRTNPQAGCMPVVPLRVLFTAPVPRAAALGVRLRLPDGSELAPASPEASELPTLNDLTFTGPFPELTSVTVTLPKDLRDDAGRPPDNAARFPLEVSIDEFPPLVKFSAEFGILEAGEGGVLPVTVRNVEAQLPARRGAVTGRRLKLDANPAAISSWLERVVKANKPRLERLRDPQTGKDLPDWREATGSTSVFDQAEVVSGLSTLASFRIDLPAGGHPAEVVGIPLGEPGLHIVEIESDRLGAALLGRPAPRYVSTAALVTNLAVHFKWGRESSLAWVTRLDNGKVVPGAKVVIADYCAGTVRWEGVTDEDGIAAVNTSFGDPSNAGHCQYGANPLLVVASSGSDITFTQSGWVDGIEPYNFGINTGRSYQKEVFHSVLDRPLFRPGEVVAMKHFLGRRSMEGIEIRASNLRRRTVSIEHLGSEQRYQSQIEFGADGVADHTWTIPSDAKLGDYQIRIQNVGEDFRIGGNFKVQQYRLPTMRASVQGPVRPLVRPREVELNLHVGYLSGGSAGGLPVKLRTVVEPTPLRFSGYDEYSFGGAPVTEGVSRQDRNWFDIDPEAADGARAELVTQVMPLTLDRDGAARVTIPDLPETDEPSRLVAELEYTDASGEVLTTATRVRLLSSSISLGIRREGWVASDDQLRFKVVALDVDGRPVARQRIHVALYRAVAFSYRKRLIGGFYAYETLRETTRLGVACDGKTDRQGVLTCEVAPGVAGEIILRAESRDTGHQASGATTSIWVAGEEDWWFGGTQGDRMDVLPEQTEYETGEVARFQVRMPFRSATALVTVEREGVMDGFVTRLSGRKPVVKVPIGKTYSPNVFVSVLAVRGRVGAGRRGPAEDPERITALVDLNKPSYRLGMAEVKVGWRPHRLQVEVEPAKAVYGIRETAEVGIRVKRADGSQLPPNAEVAVAAVDEALLELAANPSWKLLDAMMGERGLEVWTATAQMQVVGKRHYGRKAVPHGGGGGRDRAREQFDSLLLWKARVPLDANGEARLTVPLNDSLSSFRIVAIAHVGTGLFGTGSASIATTQPLILHSGLPPSLREGDRVAATFTVRNTTPVAMAVDVTVSGAPAGVGELAPQRVQLAPGQAADVKWTVTVPVGVERLAWDVIATDIAGVGRDRVRVNAQVIPAVPVRTWQATIAQVGDSFALPLQRPARAVSGRGGLEVTLRARLGGGLEGVREYMAGYPYNCIEQHLSRAVALRDARLWQRWIGELPAFLDNDGLVRYFATEQLQGEDILTAYILTIANEAGYEIPEATRKRLIGALTDFVEGRIVRRSALPTADLGIRKLAAIDALARYSAATPQMLDSLTIEPELWPTSAVLDWLSILDRVSGVRESASRTRAAEAVLRSRLDFRGTTMGFGTERTDALWWLMISADSNAARVLLTSLTRASWREDVPRLVRGVLGRQRRGHWNTTVANAWGVLAMEKFSAAFEQDPVSGETSLSYGGERRIARWPGRAPQAEFTLPWQPGRQTLTAAHAGSGRPWAMVRAQAALPLESPVSAGFRITRSIAPVDQQVSGRWSRGDVARIRLEIEAQSDVTWVVVDDPVPAGATILGSGLGGQSDLLQRGERSEGWAWPAFVERRFDAFRAYYRFVPKGSWAVEYTMRLNNPGTFVLPATRVEAMYAPEMLGETPNAAVVVDPAP